jgi:hypothetical protein
VYKTIPTLGDLTLWGARPVCLVGKTLIAGFVSCNEFVATNRATKGGPLSGYGADKAPFNFTYLIASIAIDNVAIIAELETANEAIATNGQAVQRRDSIAGKPCFDLAGRAASIVILQIAIVTQLIRRMTKSVSTSGFPAKGRAGAALCIARPLITLFVPANHSIAADRRGTRIRANLLRCIRGSAIV